MLNTVVLKNSVSFNQLQTKELSANQTQVLHGPFAKKLFITAETSHLIQLAVNILATMLFDLTLLI